jgi:hypothetical protein
VRRGTADVDPAVVFQRPLSHSLVWRPLIFSAATDAAKREENE